MRIRQIITAAALGSALVLGAGVAPTHGTPAQGLGTAESRGAAPTASVVQNRIMSWNSNGQENGTPALVAAQIKRFKPQIVLLQESCKGEVDTAVRTLRQQGLVYKAYHADWPDLFTLGCDNGPLQVTHSVLVAEGTTMHGTPGTALYEDRDWPERRKFTIFQVRLAGMDVYVANTHLSDGGDADLRQDQLNQLMEATRGMPNMVLAGDLNAQPSYPEMEPLWAYKFADADPSCTRGKNPQNSPCQYTQVGSKKKFDYVMTKGAVHTKRCTLGHVNDDHRVVVSDLTAGAPSGRVCDLV
ncbi:endonuclease/exonuclease/phosphatase family protein [Streptomyces sp. WMMC500]|uniref:endonuclease/exonuclease/phosphatase family protein n=1 Tax=Streptomyces sp. WMMC500 TaxID=3015154 RepID=UPI00248C52AC|nr:endonuclease/exonuclease/phosphatase family protein [Streptomyces sp. WMMC500]WBB62916.1 endonuclease/exonuclease/phosphatase family protein [Streptomyces sp. WMMC500]